MDEKSYAVAEEVRLSSDQYLEIEGGTPLKGEVNISGAKNAALPAIVAACLSSEEVVLNNIPVELNDIKLLIKLLRSVGAEITQSNDTLTCTGRNWKGGSVDPSIANLIRHSLLLLGASANWNTPLDLPLPGGCSIGNRKHDLHVKALQLMGYSVSETDFGLHLKPQHRNNQTIIDFHYPTFGGTLNVLFASVQSNKKRTVILKNAALNPEVMDVINLLKNMGAQIEWLNSSTLRITSVKKLKGACHTVMSDRVVAATVISAVGVTRGQAFLQNATTRVLESEVAVWRCAGLNIMDYRDGILVECNERTCAVDIVTEPYPGFHTDIQPLHTVLMTLSKGDSIIKETILDGRFLFCNELKKMGANIKIENGGFKCVNGSEGQIAKVSGVSQIFGSTNLVATDIRGGAAVVVAALAAHGKSRVTNIYQIERGYSNFEKIFNGLGAKIKKVYEQRYAK